MPFSNGLLTAGEDSLTVRARLEEQMLLAGWQFASEYLVGTQACRVWRNPASNQSPSTGKPVADFYIALYTSSAVTLGVTIAELYDDSTKLFRKYASGYGTSAIFDTDGTVSDPTGKPPHGSSGPTQPVWSAVSNTTLLNGYCVQATKDYVMFNGAGLNNTALAWAGRYRTTLTNEYESALGVGVIYPFSALFSLTSKPLAGNGQPGAVVVVDGFSNGARDDPFIGGRPYVQKMILVDNSGRLRGGFRDMLYIPNLFNNYDDEIIAEVDGVTDVYARAGATIWVRKAAV